MSKEQNCRLGKVGGRAVLEGVMMKSGDNVSLAVRKEDGTIEVKNSTHVSLRKKHKICNIPLIRGCVNMVETLIMSMGTLEDSANMLGIDETEEETKFEKWLRDKFGDKLMSVIMGIGMVLGIILSIGLFVLLPNFAVFGINALCEHFGDFSLPSLAQNAVSGVLRIAIFVGYILLVSLMKDIRRTFEYHGAEHKSIACYEAGEELTAENAKKYTRFHPRCGTSFIIIVLIISILATTFINWNTWSKWAIILTKLAMLPVIVGISFEFLIWAGKHPNPVTKFLSAPGLWMQRITTREPDEGQLEVAITALKNAMPSEFPEARKENDEEKAEDAAPAEDTADQSEDNSGCDLQ
ncbi:MAG: DUF1385 domain-containing protein [Clostridia bacterium]|nr:DUF1385 domain-containing protein [Clostridia bacterium]